jgi:FdrA protein
VTGEAVRGVVWRSSYQDSMALMRLAATLRERPGVREAAALMGTPANHEVLRGAGLAVAGVADAGPGDLVLVVAAATEADAEAALAAARDFFERRQRVAEETGHRRPRTLASARQALPEANLAVISVPGAYAAAEATRALKAGLHVFLFSDNVALEDEVALKRLAVERGLFCMGPDCGTAYVSGVGLGFANVVTRGRVGGVAASGTGLQAVVSRLDALGEGVSHAIGVGSRDLGAEVGGAMTNQALAALAADPGTEVIVVISKPPAPSALPGLEQAIRATGKPAVVCCLGAPPRRDGAGQWVATLDDAATCAAATLKGVAWTPRSFTDPARVRARLGAAGGRAGGGILGLYTGGTLAHEARLVLEPLLGAVAYGSQGDGAHRVLDLGDDEFTVGRPHPMIDPDARAARVREAGGRRDVGVLLLDLVLGKAVHPDPAAPLASAVLDARRAAARAGRSLTVVAAVVGTARDPQGLHAQVSALEAAGAIVLPSSAEAARFAALAVRPDLAATLLEAS